MKQSRTHVHFVVGRIKSHCASCAPVIPTPGFALLANVSIPPPRKIRPYLHHRQAAHMGREHRELLHLGVTGYPENKRL